MPRIGSSTSPLGANGTWDTGVMQPGLSDRITGAVFSDQVGTIYIEQSGDGTNWDISTNYAVAAGDGEGFSEEVLLPFVRVRYLNGGIAQTVFRLYARMTSAGTH